MAATPVYYLTTAGTGITRQLATTAVTTASTSKTSYGALTLTQTDRQFVPETTSSTGTIPAAGTAWNLNGWQSTAAIIPLADAGVTRASTVTVTVGLALSTGSATISTTVILYSGTTELGRGTNASAAASTTNTGFPVSVAVNAGVAIAANALLGIAIYTTSTNVSLGTTTIALSYAAATTFLNGINYTINAIRTGSETTTRTDTASRVVSVSRTDAEALATMSDSDTRVVSFFRRDIDAENLEVATAIRQVTFSPIATDSTGTIDTATRTTIDVRRDIDLNPTIVDTASRVFVKSLTASDTLARPVDSLITQIIYGRNTANYFQPTDPPLLAPTKTIAGVVYDSNGLIWTQVATVELVRDSDNLTVATTTSNATTGAYSFPRNVYDTETYHVLAYDTVSSTSYQDMTRHGLAPV